MDLKVWVEGAVRVVSGLSRTTSCQDVVVALAQSIGQTGRYILVLKLRGTEQHLVAEDCPLQSLAQLGQLAAEVRFVLRRTGPSLSEGPGPRKDFPLPRPLEPEPLKRSEPQKAFTFNLGPSTGPKRTKPNEARSLSPRASPEPRASPVSFTEPHNKEVIFRQILQQQRILEELEVQVQALERETAFWERETTNLAAPDPNLVGVLDRLEARLRRNEAELQHGEHQDQELEEETDREGEMQRRLNQICSSVEDQSHEIRALQASSAQIQQELQSGIQRTNQNTDETLRPLKQELLNRLQRGEELDSALWETQGDLQTAEERVKERLEALEELKKEVRQRELRQFIRKTGIVASDSVSDKLASSAGRHGGSPGH